MNTSKNIKDWCTEITSTTIVLEAYKFYFLKKWKLFRTIGTQDPDPGL